LPTRTLARQGNLVGLEVLGHLLGAPQKTLHGGQDDKDHQKQQT